MSDPIRDLEDFRTDVPGMFPLPAAEVRRRGDRMRRRRQALVAAGAAAAVAVVAATGAVASGALQGGDRPAPPVTTPKQGTEAPMREIPDDFPLDHLATEESGATIDDSAALSTLNYCGTKPLAALDPVDVRSVTLGAGEAWVARTLYLLDSVEAAQAAHDEIAEAAWACSFADPGVAGSGDVTIQPTVSSWPGNTITEDHAWGNSTVSTEPTVDVVHVVSRGAALLVTSTMGAWSDDVGAGVKATREEVRPIVEAMEVFEGSGDAG